MDKNDNVFFSTCFVDKTDRLRGKLYLNDRHYIDFDKKVYIDIVDGVEKVVGGHKKYSKNNTIENADWEELEAIIKNGKNKEDYSAGTLGNKVLHIRNSLKKAFAEMQDRNAMIGAKSGEKYFFNAPCNAKVYKLKKIDLEDDYIPENILKILEDDMGLDNFSVATWCKSFFDKSTKSTSVVSGDNTEGFLLKFFKKYEEYCKNNKEQYSYVNIDAFLKDVLKLGFDESEILAFKTTDHFPPQLTVSDAAFCEFGNNQKSEEILRYYKNSLYKFWKMGSNAYEKLRLIEDAFCDAYKNSENLTGLMKYRTISADGIEKICDFLKRETQSASASGGINRESFAVLMYSVMFFISHGYICRMFYEKINGIDGDREEFTKEVLAKYGCVGNPGLYAIYNLAYREPPNVIALFEAAELEYYGRGVSGKVNYEKAFELYKKGYEAKNFNPLCAWSYAFMLYNNEKKGFNLKALKDKTPAEQKIMAIKPTRKAYDCGCYAAANLLGQIVADGEIDYKHKDQLSSNYIEYYEFAAKSGYVFAKNRLWNYYKKKAENEDDLRQREIYENTACEYLKSSAESGEPYACNNYARDLVKEKKYSEAFVYFKRACDLGNEWAAVNVWKEYIVPYFNDGKDNTGKNFSEEDFIDLCYEISKILENSANSEITDAYKKCHIELSE